MTSVARRLSILALCLAFAVVPLASQSPSGVEILLGKARSLEARGRLDLAAQNWDQVLLVNPNQPDALAGLARFAKQNGDATKLRTYLDRLRARNPKDPAIAAIERMRVLTPTERARLDEAGRLTVAGKPDEAMKIYREVFGNEPPWGKWAEAYYETQAMSSGGRQATLSQLRALSAREPDNDVYRTWLAKALSYQPETRMEALRLFESIRDSGSVEQARTIWRQTLVWERENPAALQSLEAYIKRYPDRELQESLTRLRNDRARVIQEGERQRGFDALKTKDMATAERKFGDVLQRAPKDVGALVGLGFVRLDQKRFNDALVLFDQARALSPKRADVVEGYETAQYWSAMERGAALETRDGAAAVAAYQLAQSVRPREDGPVLAIAQVRLRQRDLAGARRGFEQVLQQAPNNVDAIAGLGFVHLNEKSFPEAAALLEKARTLAPNRRDVEEGYRNARFWGLMTEASAAFDRNQAEVAFTRYSQALTLNPGAKDALRGQAGAAERAKKYPEALQAYTALTTAAPDEVNGWMGLIRTQMNVGAASDAVGTVRRVPAPVRAQLETRVDYLAQMSLALMTSGLQKEGEGYLLRAMDVAERDDTKEALGARLQVADLLMKQGDVRLAVSVYQNAIASQPDNVTAWQALVGAYASTGDQTRALNAIRTMPRAAYDAATKNAGFLEAAAAAYVADGQCGQAEGLLTHALNLHRAGRESTDSTELQLADVWMRQRRYDKARDGYRAVISRTAQSIDGWRGYVNALHQLGEQQTLVAEARRMPEPIRTRLEADLGVLMMLASAYSSAGEHDQAARLLRDARARYRSKGETAPADLDLQLAWATLASTRPDDVTELLASLRSRADLTQSQRDAVAEIRTTSVLRRADTAAKSGQHELAVKILTDARREMPDNPKIPAALAAVHLREGDHAKALAIYQSWGMTGADVGDYRGAVGAALAEHDTALVEQFLKAGLQQWPTDKELLHTMGRQVAARGDYRDAERLMKQALAAPNVSDTPARLSVSAAPPPSQATVRAAACRQEVARADPEGPRLVLASVRGITVPAAHAQSRASEPQTGSAETSSDSRVTQDPQDTQQIRDDIDSIRHRNAPFLAVGASMSGRAGDPGINRLIVREATPSGSVTIGDSVRVGVDVHTVDLSSGDDADGQSEARFGTLPPGTSFAAQTAMGYGGEVQLSTEVFGVSIGATPRGFLTETWTGGLRLGAADGPVRLMAVRDRVKDSLLSYAGARDPGTGIVWGGVVSNSVALLLNRNVSGHGQYASLGVGYLHGELVEDNWSAEGSAGTYWNIGTGGQSNLTVGLNVTGMSYRKNSNFFSLGQGGYFSPQRFVQGTVPISWSLRHARTSYEIAAGPGFQYFSEDDAPFFPVAGLVPPSSLRQVFEGQSHKGPSYSVAVRADYRVTSHWHIGLSAAANNTRDFDSRSAGVVMKFLTRPVPPSTDLRVKSIPDWRGAQPLKF